MWAPVEIESAWSVSYEPALCNSLVHPTLSLSLSLPILINLSVSTAIFPGEPRLVSFIGAKDDGSGGVNWSYKKCRAPGKSSPPTN